MSVGQQYKINWVLCDRLLGTDADEAHVQTSQCCVDAILSQLQWHSEGLMLLCCNISTIHLCLHPMCVLTGNDMISK